MKHATRTEQHDVVVVGSRCAGAATAMLLAQQGLDVVVVDRCDFPSDTVSTHSIARGGVVQLARWDLLDQVVASGAPPIREVSFHIGGDVVRKPIKAAAGVDHLVAPRRDALDDILVNAARRAGADVRAGITITGVCHDESGRASGVIGRDTRGVPVHVPARFVVGADGLRSLVARSVDAPLTDRRHANGAVFYTYVAGLEFSGTEFHIADGAFAGLFPTHHGEANVWIATPAIDIAHLRGHPDRNRAFQELLSHIAPEFGDRVATARQTAPVRGFARMPNQLRQPVGDGWALVGDASYFRDAITGHGITDAFRDAELLARAVGTALGDGDEREVMSRYHARRDELVRELFDITTAMALFPPVDEFTELQKRLSRRIEAEAQMLADLPATHTLATSAA